LYQLTLDVIHCGEFAIAAEGLTTVPSGFGPQETMDRLEAEVRAMGMTVFARIDHAAAATSAGLALRPPAVAPMILGAI